MKHIFITFLTVIIIATSIKSQWINVEKPRGGIVISTAISGNTLLAGTQDNSLFYSTDNGNLWIELPNAPGPHTYNSLAASGQNIFINELNYMYRSTNSGLDWQLSLNTRVSSIAAKDSNAYVCANSSLMYSSDIGASWRFYDSPLTRQPIRSIALTDTMIAASCANGIIYSRDSGINWYLIAPPNNRNVLDNVIINNSRILGRDGSKIFYTNNFGSSWEQSEIDSLPTMYIPTIIANNSNLYAVSSFHKGKGIYRSTNNGESWFVSNNGLKTFDITSISGNDSILMVSTSFQGIYLSTNQGESWYQSNEGLPELQDITLLGTVRNELHIKFSGSVYASTNNGLTWKNKSIRMNYPEDNIYSIAMHKEKLFAATNFHGVYSSSNNGETWIKTNQDTIYNIHLIESDDSVLVALTGSYLYYNYNLIRSTNDGTTWHSVNPGYIYFHCLTQKDHIFYAGSNEGVFLSTDYGENWSSSNSGLTDNNIMSLAMSGSTIFAGTLDSGVFVSVNNGQNWQAVNHGLANRKIYQLLANDSLIFALTFGGIYYSHLDAMTWKNFDQGIIGRIYQIGLTDNYLFAALENQSLWKREISDLVASIKENTEPVSRFSLGQNYPNPFNPLTSIEYSLTEKMNVKLSVFDILGRSISILVDEFKSEGRYLVNFDGKELPSGIYFYRLETGGFNQTRKLILLK